MIDIYTGIWRKTKSLSYEIKYLKLKRLNFTEPLNNHYRFPEVTKEIILHCPLSSVNCPLTQSSVLTKLLKKGADDSDKVSLLSASFSLKLRSYLHIKISKANTKYIKNSNEVIF